MLNRNKFISLIQKCKSPEFVKKLKYHQNKNNKDAPELVGKKIHD